MRICETVHRTLKDVKSNGFVWWILFKSVLELGIRKDGCVTFVFVFEMKKSFVAVKILGELNEDVLEG